MTKNDPELLRAQDASTPPTVLKKLSASKTKGVRREVAKNPNTPIEVLYTLGEEFPKEFLENPSLPLLLLEEPKLFERIPSKTLAKILQLEEVSDFLIERLNDEAILIALRVRKISKRVIEGCFAYTKKENDSWLRKEENQKIKEKLAAHPCTTAKILLALARENHEVRGRLAKNEISVSVTSDYRDAKSSGDDWYRDEYPRRCHQATLVGFARTIESGRNK